MADGVDSLPGEIWKPVPGYEKEYRVSSLGRVMSVDKWVNSKNGSLALRRAILLVPSVVKRTGYSSISLHRNGASRTTNVHRVVCEAFHGTMPGWQVAHNDGCRTNNAAANLRWATAKENAADRNRHGTAPIGEGAGNSKLREADVLAIRREYTGEWGELKRIALKFGVTSTQILHIVKRRQWTHI